MKSTTIVSELPCIVKVESNDPIAYGVESLAFPVGPGTSVKIDRAFLSGKSTLRLRHIKACLKSAGRTNDKEARKWFNHEVRDAWHKALRYANRAFASAGKPATMGLTQRTTKLGETVTTDKFGYEIVQSAPGKAIANGEAKAQKQSTAKAKRQQRKAKPIVNPVIPPERNVTIANPVTVEVTA